VLRAVVLTQYRRVTDGQMDGQTDGIAVASTALAMQALRRAVKTRCFIYDTCAKMVPNLGASVASPHGVLTQPRENIDNYFVQWCKISCWLATTSSV